MSYQGAMGPVCDGPVVCAIGPGKNAIIAFLIFAACVTGPEQVRATDLKDRFGVLVDLHRMLGHVDGDLSLNTFDQSFVEEDAARRTTYDYRYNYPIWRIDASATAGLPGNSQLYVERDQLIPYDYRYNAVKNHSSPVTGAAGYIDYSNKIVADNTTMVSFTRRNADNSAEFYLDWRFDEDFFESQQDRFDLNPAYELFSKTSYNTSTFNLRTRYLTGASPKMAYISSDLDGRFFPFLNAGQLLTEAQVQYQNFIPEYYEASYDFYYGAADARNYNYVVRRLINQGAGVFTVTSRFRYGIRDDIEGYGWFSYVPALTYNTDYLYTFPNDMNRTGYLINDTEHHFYGYGTLNLRMRHSPNAQSDITAYILCRQFADKTDYRNWRGLGTISEYSQRHDFFESTPYFRYKTQYMSEGRDVKMSPYNGSNMDSIYRPLLDRDQVLLENTVTVSPYWRRTVLRYMNAAPAADYRYGYSYTKFTVNPGFGYGIRSDLELAGSVSVTFPYDYGYEYSRSNGVTAVSTHYHTLFGAEVKLTYRPRGNCQFFIDFDYSPSAADNYNTVTNVSFKDSSRADYESSVYRAQFGIDLLF